MTVNVNGGTITVAGTDGTVASIDAATGRDLWRASAGGPLSRRRRQRWQAGGGGDAQQRAGRAGRRQGGVAPEASGGGLYRSLRGGRPRVRADRRPFGQSAFDGRSGRKLWTQQRPGEPLVLRHPGVMLAVGDTLVVGLSGRMAGLDPLTGAVRWEAPLASPRGINDVERLVDLVGTVSRVGESVCARAFQASVGCVNAARGTLLWTKPANGAEGVHGDDKLVFGTEADGKVIAWRRENGERAWMTDKLQLPRADGPAGPGPLGRGRRQHRPRAHAVARRRIAPQSPDHRRLAGGGASGGGRQHTGGGHAQRRRLRLRAGVKEDRLEHCLECRRAAPRHEGPLGGQRSGFSRKRGGHIT